MDCREFRNKHVAYVDDLLSAVDMEAVRRHLSTCSRCSRQDTAVRRSLLLVRNLRPIEPSPDFMRRLNARIAEIGPAPRSEPSRRTSLVFSTPAIGTFAALAAGIGFVAVLAMHTTRYFSPAPSDAATPIIAAVTAPAPDVTPVSETAPMANAAYVAAVPTGIPIWPAMLMVGEAPVRFASIEAHESDGR